MSDPQISTMLDDYTADPPTPLPAGASVLALARRAHRVRRIRSVGVAALAGVTAVAAGLVLLPDQSRAPAPDAAPESMTACAGPRPTRSEDPTGPLPNEFSTWAVRTVTCFLAEALPGQLPQASYEQAAGLPPVGPLTAYITAGPAGPQSTPTYRIDAAALVRDPQGVGDFHLAVSRAAPGELEQQAAACRNPISNCAVRPGPDGATVLVHTSLREPPTFSQYEVTVFRAGTRIWINASNTDRTSPLGGGAPIAMRPDPILTVDQIIGLALSPELVLYR